MRIMCSDCDKCVEVYGDLRHVKETDLKLSCEQCEPKEKYRVQTEHWMSKEYKDLDEATDEYEETKEWSISEGVTEDSFVELVSSKDDFEDYEVIKRANVVVDMEKMAISTPREEGFDWDYWAKWQD